jgi:kinesin family protein 23
MPILLPVSHLLNPFFLQDFLQAKNSLLFAYGITGSGKTYTMSGTPNEPGIMPRCLDVIFNSISDVKAPMKYLFKSDHLNGFEVQSKAEAMLDRQKEIAAANVPKTPGRALRR